MKESVIKQSKIDEAEYKNVKKHYLIRKLYKFDKGLNR